MSAATTTGSAGAEAPGAVAAEAPLRDFVHVAWRDEAARAVWEPRVAAIQRAWAEIEWRSVVAGVRQCGLTVVAPEAWVELSARLVAHGLTGLPLQLHAADASYTNRGELAGPGDAVALRVVMGRLDDALAMRRAWRPTDDAAIGTLLGFPPCCRRFFQRVWVGSDAVDTTWAMSLNGNAPEPEINDPAGRHRGEDGGADREASGPPEANILLRWIGLRAVPHLPCSFRCEASAELGRRLMEVGRDAGFAAEMGWLAEALAWPTTWRAFGSVATVSTPVLGFATNTNPVAAPRSVSWRPA